MIDGAPLDPENPPASDVPARDVQTPYGRFNITVARGVLHLTFLPVGQLGRLQLALRIRDDYVCNVALSVIEGTTKLTELAAVLDSQYPNYVPSGLYSALSR